MTQTAESIEEISIHAPTRGATLSPESSITDIIFQSTLPREERRSTAYQMAFSQKFQSTLPREERRFRSSIEFNSV